MQSKFVIEAVIGLVLFVYVAAATLPGAISTVAAINASSSSGYGFWGSSVNALWGLLPLFVVIALIIMVYKHVKM